jgi:hypothetical protein
VNDSLCGRPGKKLIRNTGRLFSERLKAEPREPHACSRSSHPQPHHPPRAIPLKRTRFWLICLFFFCWACAIAGALFWLQIVRHKEFVERAQKQQQRTFEVAPRRGVLYDRNLRELAMTVQVDSIYAVPLRDRRQAGRRCASWPRWSTPTPTTRRPLRADCRPPRRRPQLCLDCAPRHAGCRRPRESP